MKDKIVVNKLLKLYHGLGWKSLFTKIRLKDAPYKQADALVPKKGNIIELGCGEGLFSNYMALSSGKRNVIGIEIDEVRFRQASRGIGNTKFILGDATKANMQQCDAIVMMHLLHHLRSFEYQEKLLKTSFSKLGKRGKLIIVEVEPKLSLKYFFSWFTDHFIVAWLFDKKFYSVVYFRKKNDWMNLLIDIGFKVNYYPADKNMPFQHIIFECIKR